MRRLGKELQFAKSQEEAKEYDIKNAKEEKDNLMSHYDSILKKKQAEIEAIKSR